MRRGEKEIAKTPCTYRARKIRLSASPRKYKRCSIKAGLPAYNNGGFMVSSFPISQWGYPPLKRQRGLRSN